MSWFFFGNRSARESMEESPEAPQAQQDASSHVQALLTDKEKWQRSKQRWNANIKPTDEAFTTKYNHFIEQLRTRSPEAVVKAEFSNHEVRKFLNGYVDKKRFKAINEQQIEERNLYKHILESPDYKDVQSHTSPLALKLTMMHFGLPVAPMSFTDPLQSSGDDSTGNLVFSTGLSEDEDEVDDEDMSFVPEEMRPLRFLNYYEKRGHGTDNSHMNPEKTYELFYGIPMVVPTHELMSRMRLRGAGINDASHDSVMDDASDGPSPMMAPPSTKTINVTRISPHLALCEGGGGANAGEQIYLWGLSGRTVFSYFDAKSFFSAIDRNLALSKRSDDLSSVGITISLLSHPKGERGPCVVLASDQCFLGRSEEDELNFYRTWLETVQYFDDQVEDGTTLDICIAQISDDIHFSDMQKDLAYRPSLEGDEVVSFSLSNDKSGALSYLSMKSDSNFDTAVDNYNERFKSLWRTLSCPNEEQLKTYSIGSNQVLPPQSCLINIKCADSIEDEGEHWFSSDVGPTSEAWDHFTDAYQAKGRREFILDVIPMADPQASLIIVPTEVDFVTSCSDHIAQEIHEQDRKFYWGRHNHIRDAIAFQETDRPQMQPATDHPLQLNPLGRPVNGVQLDDFAKGKAFREWSYAHPLSIHMQGQHPSIPINAPPLETILKTPGINGLRSDSVPVMSTQVLTPTEQRDLQETVFELRSLALNRAQPCPFRPCRDHFAVDDAGRQHFRDHIQNTHIDKRCPLCDDKMFGYYDERAKQQHFYEKHVYYFSHKDDLHMNTVFEVHSKNLTHDRERKWNFCARCGRDHNQLNVNGDRAQHDNICYPGVTEEETQCKYCVNCGGSTSGTAEHICTLDPTADPNTKAVHCKQCALPTHKLARSYAEKHLARCRGSHSNTAHWCPWCGQNLMIYSRTQSYKHLDECIYKPPTGEGPVNTITGEASESPKDSRETRYWEKQFPFTRNIIQIPKNCHVKGCTEKNLQELDADALLDHYSAETHANATDRLRFCPICSIDFVQREWVQKQQKVDHFRDHIEKREERINLDLEIAKAINKLDTVTLAKINLRNEDEFASTTNEPNQHHAAGWSHSVSAASLERLLEDQKLAKREAEGIILFQRERLELLEIKFETLMEALTDAFAQNRTGKRAYEPTSTADNSDASSSKKQRTAISPEPIDPRTPQRFSPSQKTQHATPSTGSSGAIMTPSDDSGPPGNRGSHPQSSASSGALDPLVSQQVTQSAVRIQGRNTPKTPRTSRQRATEPKLATAPITFKLKSPKSGILVQSGSSATRTRARRAQISRAVKDEHSVADEDDDDQQQQQHEEEEVAVEVDEEDEEAQQ